MFKYELKKYFCDLKVLISFFLFYMYVFVELMILEEDIWLDWFVYYVFNVKILCMLLIFLTAPVFANEYEVGMLEILMTSRRGRFDLQKVKLKICLLITNGVIIVFFLVAYLGFGISTGIWNWDIPIDSKSLLIFYGHGEIRNYSDLLLQVFFNTILSINLVMVFTLLLSKKTRNTVSTLVISIVLYFVVSANTVIKLLHTDFAKILVQIFPMNMIFNDTLNIMSVELVGYRFTYMKIVEAIYLCIIGGVCVIINNSTFQA